MRIVAVTLFPEMFEAISEYGVSGRAIANGLLSLRCVNPREFTDDRHQTVDDRPYGGGPGMVMMVEPLKKAVKLAQDWLFEQGATKPKVIYLSPQGRKLTQAGVVELRECTDIILVAGRYEGVDERFIQSVVDEEWSVGDYVLSGGELPAMVMIDALTRLLPGALGDEMSAEQDSFSAGLLDCPHYTRPPVVDGVSVPAVLLSGDHKKISRWRLQQSLGKTWERRPDLLEKLQLDEVQRTLLKEYLADKAVNDVNFD